ncbi:MAG TPA: DUF3168 domain-containing protein [Dehalococcoidia bacterium]|nr:DUF3168 domain-containing protein [Dehalococcoidia bacterium]
MIDKDLVAFLKARQTGAGTRVHSSLLPQETAYPAVAVTRISGSVDRGLGGEVILGRGTWRIDVYGRDFESMFGVSDEIRDALDGFRGLMGTTSIKACQLQSFSDFSEEDGERKLRHLVHDFSIVHSED